MKYPDLDYDSRKAIWKTFFNRASANIGSVSEEDISRLASHALNGRQVSSCISNTNFPLTRLHRLRTP